MLCVSGNSDSPIYYTTRHISRTYNNKRGNRILIALTKTYKKTHKVRRRLNEHFSSQAGAKDQNSREIPNFNL